MNDSIGSPRELSELRIKELNDARTTKLRALAPYKVARAKRALKKDTP